MLNQFTSAPSDYTQFLASKRLIAPSCGFEPGEINGNLFGFQAALVRWACKQGRAALFATTGTGKTRMQIAWAEQVVRQTGGDVLILAPLAVNQQTVREGAAIGIPVTPCRSQADVRPWLNIANYEMLEHFAPSHFAGIVLDESGVLKAYTGVTKRKLIASFRQTPYRLCCTATPAPNDVVELCNHADFLSVMPAHEMISIFFTPKGNKTTGHYVLKRHARRAFYQWLASWAMSLNAPSDLGYPDDGYLLPPLEIRPTFIETTWRPSGQLLFTGLKGVMDRAAARRGTEPERIAATLDLVRAEPEEPWVIWCGLNSEQDAVADALGDRCISVYGSLSPAEKERRLLAWLDGEAPYLASKVGIAGFGLNMQRCARVAFLGLSDSYEQYFQAIRRCWRFGQTRRVIAHIVLSTAEQDVYNNVLRKEQEATALSRELVAAVRGFERAELAPMASEALREANTTITLPAWLKEETVCRS